MVRVWKRLCKNVFNNHCTLSDAICLMVRQRSDVMAYLPGRPRLRLLCNTFLPVPASKSLSIFRLLLSLSGGDVRLWEVRKVDCEYVYSMMVGISPCFDRPEKKKPEPRECVL